MKHIISDIRVSETDTWHQLKASKRIGSYTFKMLDAYWVYFECSFLCLTGIALLKLRNLRQELHVTDYIMFLSDFKKRGIENNN